MEIFHLKYLPNHQDEYVMIYFGYVNTTSKNLTSKHVICLESQNLTRILQSGDFQDLAT